MADAADEIVARARQDLELAKVMRKIVAAAHQVTRLCNYEETVNYVSFTAEPVEITVEEWRALNALPGMGYPDDPQPEPGPDPSGNGGEG